MYHSSVEFRTGLCILRISVLKKKCIFTSKTKKYKVMAEVRFDLRNFPTHSFLLHYRIIMVFIVIIVSGLEMGLKRRKKWGRLVYGLQNTYNRSRRQGKAKRWSRGYEEGKER